MFRWLALARTDSAAFRLTAGLRLMANKTTTAAEGLLMFAVLRVVPQIEAVIAPNMGRILPHYA